MPRNEDRFDRAFDRMEERFEKAAEHPVRTGFAALVVGALAWLLLFAGVVGIILIALNIANVI